MVDIVDRATRSRMMSGIRGKNTRIEVALRHALFARGWRYRLHTGGLPGRPDMVFPGRRAVVFVHGCFWHGHDCELFRLPATRRSFWRAKIGQNRRRDRRTRGDLVAEGWRVMIVWECAWRGREPAVFDRVVDRVDRWLRSNRKRGEVRE